MPMGFVKKHVAVEMEDSKSSDEDADIKKGEILKSVSDSDEDNFVEYVEFNEVQHRRRAIFGYGVDSGDQKVLNCDWYYLHFSRTNVLILNREGVAECQETIFQFLFLYRCWSMSPCFVESGIY